MALFLVLVFQVLFVFFAMSINVGLVVYDKINLQNATDIAAYYAAQKQSEMLNQIAHINYQMRQAYKLLTFRIRVIGSVSIGAGGTTTLPAHPVFSGPNPAQEAAPFFFKMGTGILVPGVCVGSTIWKEYSDTEDPKYASSLCATLQGTSFVPNISGGSDPLGLIGGLNQFLTAIQLQGIKMCETVNVLNWQVASSFLTAYILESQRRLEMIRQLSTKLSQPAQQMTDYVGQSVYNATLKTLQKNLTEPQQGSLQMTMLNSLSSDVPGPCSDPNYWLPPIDIYPAVTYVQMQYVPSVLRCENKVVANRSSSTVPPATDLAKVGGRNNGMLSNVWASQAPITYGVEKNPWCMPYVKISAQTQPRKIFSPFGGTITLKAEAYAKPFGGRMGPWYSNQWPSGSNTSQGLNRLDPLLPARSVNGQRMPLPVEDDLVNYSKYPGDKLGMNSTYALGAMSNYWNKTVMKGVGTRRTPLAALSLAHYNHVGDPNEFDAHPDSLAKKNNSTVAGDPIRWMEETSVAPDLFDITYYSIEGQYSANYFNPNLESFSSSDQFTKYFLDLGSSDRQPYSVVQQVNLANTVYGGNAPFYAVDNPNQLLTGWTQNGAVNYEFPDTFGNCLQRNDPQALEQPSAGGCTAGGRSGYSVKLVSKNYLLNVSADLGGPGVSGAILNPPPSQ